ncbi:MAG: FtsH protease activity modulator HflK [Porticoccaceae bacterium]|jgi:modulator of FtsH protease HflK|nr:FtsH protease activity modulator HflK [Porticoccaceae bacterium]
MAWNDPGGRDPWGGNNNSSPPDLDEAFQKLKEKLDNLFGGKPGKPGTPAKGGSNLPIYVGLLFLLGFWAYSSIYILDEQERGVVLRFGEYHSTLQPGFNFQPGLIDTVTRVNVTAERQYEPSVANSLMLTQDENIVVVPLTVQYNIKDATEYVLNIRDPEETLEQATDSAIRHVVGSSQLDNVISAGRELLRVEVELRLQIYLDNYGAGINIIDVTLQEGTAPEEVKPAFDDVIAAAADKERTINQAQAYSNQILPQARGRAQRAIEDAQAYRGELIARAQGDAARFSQLLVEYERAPEVTRERLYIDAIEGVLANTSKVMLDVESGNNMMYLPLDRLGNSGTGLSSAREEELQRLIENLENQINSAAPSSATSATRTLR